MNTRRSIKLLIPLAVMMLAIPMAVSAEHKEASYRDVLNEADANHRTALTRCDTLTAKSRAQCRDEAEETLQRQRSQAEKQREAGYEAAMEKCEPLHFNAQDVCEKEAAATYGKNN